MLRPAPRYHGGAYCLEFMELGRWRKRRSGGHLSRTYNHITLDSALYHFAHHLKLGHTIRIVHEPTGREVADSSADHCGNATWEAWDGYVTERVAAIAAKEGRPALPQPSIGELLDELRGVEA